MNDWQEALQRIIGVMVDVGVECNQDDIDAAMDAFGDTEFANNMHSAMGNSIEKGKAILDEFSSQDICIADSNDELMALSFTTHFIMINIEHDEEHSQEAKELLTAQLIASAVTAAFNLGYYWDAMAAIENAKTEQAVQQARCTRVM